MSKTTFTLAGRYTSTGAAVRLAASLAGRRAQDAADAAKQDKLIAEGEARYSREVLADDFAEVRALLTPALHFERNRRLADDLGLRTGAQGPTSLEADEYR